MHRFSFVPMILLATVVFASSAIATTGGFMDSRTIGADSFLKANPTFDGRGVVIAILDTGVDMGVPGLEKTPSGEPKVIVARDFTGEATVRLERATFDGKEAWRAGDSWVKGVDKITGFSAESGAFLGAIREAQFAGSGSPDLDRDGRTDGVFSVLVYKNADGKWRIVIDRNGDRNLADEPVIGSYEETFDYVTLFSGDPTKDLPRVTVSAHLDDKVQEPREVELHMVTASHGTHVAGIAAGYNIHGEKGYNGIAPGAKVMSLKIGNSALSGGATVTGSMKRAYEFVGRWASKHKVPVVVNMSYGVGSGQEGANDLEEFLNRFARENPNVLVVLSNGNDGPGLSSSGSPGAASTTLSVGAALSKLNAADIFGAKLQRDEMFAFSGRGGEIAKPDVVAPGIASSSVPYFQQGDVFRGTSMAAPEVAGAAALVLSASMKDPEFGKWHSGMLKAAFMASAKPLAGYNALDQGAGMIDVAGALKAFKTRLKDPLSQLLLEYRIEAPSSTLARKNNGSFWRAGGWAPTVTDQAVVQVSMSFLSSVDPKTVADTRAQISLSTSSAWLKLSKQKLVLKGNAKSSFTYYVDRTKVSNPGVHVALIKGTGPGQTSFTIPVSVVTPYPAPYVDGVSTISLKRVTVNPAGLVRIPFALPSNTTTMTISCKSADKASEVLALMFDGSGHRFDFGDAVISGPAGRSVNAVITNMPRMGVGEFILYVQPAAPKAAAVDVEIKFFSLSAKSVDTLHGAAGQAPGFRTEVMNNMPEPFIGQVQGELSGVFSSFERSIDQKLLVHEFYISDEYRSVELELEISPENWSRFTDIAVNVLDSNGKAVVQTGFSNPRTVVRVDNRGTGNQRFKLEINAARGHEGGPNVPVKFTVRHFWKVPVKLEGKVDGNQLVRLLPQSPATLEVKTDKMPLATPQGASWFGNVDFKARRDESIWLRMPLELRRR
ncbi:MAG TPA: S8 family serine peptidase [Myxococcota bacterium]|nr:S8 family serine peptidase [Myxococcota bacterium]HPC91958.1 S8 family serine peptidase [Myxococcota bacterium]HQE73656.1 S8 family serine peptidase [Myxococcota bacterium]HQI61741.1 S8 family serine peptidase [Myxococcota bacterium]HRR74065.1 S8 family serine peptidase [Myxococcota bacterium]